MALILCWALTLASAFALTAPHPPIKPNHDAARNIAHHIFNAVHSAGRQWGSSVNQNSFRFFAAVMPTGTLTCHGGQSPEPPTTPEWLAFDTEHAEKESEQLRCRSIERKECRLFLKG